MIKKDKICLHGILPEDIRLYYTYNQDCVCKSYIYSCISL